MFSSDRMRRGAFFGKEDQGFSFGHVKFRMLARNTGGNVRDTKGDVGLDGSRWVKKGTVNTAKVANTV